MADDIVEPVPTRPKRPLSDVLSDMAQKKCTFVKPDGTECAESVKAEAYNWKRHNELVHKVDIDASPGMTSIFFDFY